MSCELIPHVGQADIDDSYTEILFLTSCNTKTEKQLHVAETWVTMHPCTTRYCKKSLLYLLSSSLQAIIMCDM